jgi:hypothetical protein
MCRPGVITQEVSIEIPEGIVLEGLPKRVSASAKNFEFKREWSFLGRTIVEQSELRSTIDTGICSPEVIAAVANAVEEIRNAVGPLLRFEPRGASNIP